METVPCNRLFFPTIYSLATLSVVISLRYRLVTSYLPSTVGGTPHSAASSSVVLEIFLLVWGSKICFGFSGFALELLLVLSGLRCFCVKFWQRHEAFLLSLL
jgi:hypothetical protein